MSRSDRHIILKHSQKISFTTIVGKTFYIQSSDRNWFKRRFKLFILGARSFTELQNMFKLT